MVTGEGFQGVAPSTTLRPPKDQAQGVIITEYWFDPGDPVGDESIEVLINDKLVKVIHYTVVPDKAE